MTSYTDKGRSFSQRFKKYIKKIIHIKHPTFKKKIALSLIFISVNLRAQSNTMKTTFKIEFFSTT